MSHKRKRKLSHNNDLPSPKRLKSDHNDNKQSQSTFPFEKAKACDKIVPLNKGKKKRLKLKLREQSIRIKQKTKEIESMQSRISNCYTTYGHYHRLLIHFANVFDQLFVSLQQKINSNHSIPLSQKTIEMLVRGVRVKSDHKHHDSDSDSDMDQDIDINDINTNQHIQYPLHNELEQIDNMLEARTQCINRFLQYIGSQIADQNDINIKLYIESIKTQMDEYWSLTKKMTAKYDSHKLLHKQQLLLEENWDLSVHYKSLLRHYTYITEHSKFVKTDTIAIKVPNGLYHDEESNGNKMKIKSESDEEETELKPEDEEQFERVKKEMQHLKDKYSTQKNELYNFQDKICEHEKTISNLKAKNENFLTQINEQNTMEQCDDLEKGFLKNMNEFSFILQEEYRHSLQRQCKDREKALKQQIEKLNETLSDTKNKLFQVQVKTIKKRKIKNKDNKKAKRDKNKDKEERKRSKRNKDKKDKEKDKEKDKVSRSRSPSSSSKSRSRSRSRSRTKHNKSSKRDKDKKHNKSKRRTTASDSDYDNDNINEKNEMCMDSLRDYVFKQLQQQIKRNNELQMIVDEYKIARKMDIDNDDEDEECNEYKSEMDNEALKKRIQELTKQTAKHKKLNMKLQILKQEVNKSQKQMKESNEEKNKDKMLWNEEIIKLKEQNDFLVSSNHKNRAELKRMNEERKLLSVKFDLHNKQEEVYKEQIAEKENENNIIKKKEQDTITEFKIAQQSNNTLKETTKKLYQQVEGLKCDLKSRCDDYTDKSKKYQDLTKKYQSILDEKKELNSKVKSLRSSLIKYENMENDNNHNNGDINVQTLQYLLKEKKRKLTCAVCSEREKQVLLSKCLHMFCKICIQQQQTARNRSCPLCKKKFDPNSDVKPVTF